MRSHGLVFAALLALAHLLVPASTRPRLSAGSDGVYRVQADVSGLEFRTAQGARVDFGRAGLVVGGTSLPASAAAPRLDGERICFDDVGWSEQYWMRQEALEQLFVLTRPIREELDIRIPVRSALHPQALDAKTVAFADASGKNQILYKDALAMDAAGHVMELRVSVTANELAIHVPKDYLASAKFPVVVDPLVGNFETLSPAGGLWRIPGVHLAWNAKDKYYLTVWHQDIVFNSSTTQPPHNWLNGSIVRARAVRVDASGLVVMGDPITAGKPYVGVTLGPVAANNAAFGPRVRYNPSNN